MSTYTDRCLTLLRSGRPVVIFDLETTGLLPDYKDPKRPRPRAWEIAAIRRVRRDGVLKRVEGRVVIDIGERLSQELVDKFGVDPDAPAKDGRPVDQVLPKVAALMAGAILVGHNVTGFDAIVLAGDFAAAGLPVPVELRDAAHHVDTVLLARDLFTPWRPGMPENNRLATLAQWAGYDTSSTKFHQALDDTKATEFILMALVKYALARERAVA